jgi:hypothetical protein
MNRSKIKSFTALLLLFCAVLITAVTYSWLIQSYNLSNNVIGKTRSSYFAGGDGTSTNPYIITTANHFYNLAFLQNLGIFDNTAYYFKVADKIGNPVTIDFNNPKVFPVHKNFAPIGSSAHQFKGVFDGNNSVLKSYVIDGTGKQDIGTFGYVASGSSVTNLYLDSPRIVSNPASNISTTGFHAHNDSKINLATGYIVGHVATGAIVQNVFVLSPTITSLLSNYPNRSEYGLIGYTEADNGEITGGPRRYSFTLDAKNAGNALLKEVNTYGNAYSVNGTATKLNQAIKVQTNNDLQITGQTKNDFTTPTFSLSTMKVTSTQITTPVYFYDQMVTDGNQIGSGSNVYKRENIDLVGITTFTNGGIDPADTTKNLYTINMQATRYFDVPNFGATFTPTTYPASIILYVRPTTNLNDFGKITGVYKGGGDLSYNRGWVGTDYLGDNTTKTAARAAFTTSGVEATMKSSDAFTAIQVNQTTGQMTVVDPNTTVPDFYVYLLSLSNGQSEVTSINFKYIPAVVTEANLGAISKVDFINSTDLDALKISKDGYQYSFVNFGYELTAAQKLEITATKLADASFDINFTYSITDSSFFYIDLINIKARRINVKVGGVTYYTGTHTTIEILVQSGSVVVTGLTGS